MNQRAVQLGRAPSCDVVLDGADVSHWHATIALTPRLTLRDRSRNGTWVDGDHVAGQVCRLRSDSEIKIGRHRVSYEIAFRDVPRRQHAPCRRRL